MTAGLSRSQSRIQMLVLVFGAVLHLAFALLAPIDPLSGDASQFANEADAILDGRGWVNTEGEGMATTTYPSQVVMLLFTKAVFGRGALMAPVILQHLMVVLTAWLVFRYAMGLGLGFRSAITAEAILLLLPHLMKYSSILISHTSTMFLLVLAAWMLTFHRDRWWKGLIAGMVIGAAVLSRFTYQYFVFIYIASMLTVHLLKREMSLRKMAYYGCLLAGVLLVTMPWYARVRSVEGGASGYTDAWSMLYRFNRPGEMRGAYKDSIQLELMASDLPKVEQEVIYRDLALRNLREHPGWYAGNALTNLSYMLVNLSWEEQEHASVYAGMVYSMLLGFMALGLAALDYRKHLMMLPAYLIVLNTFAVHVPIYGYLANTFACWALFLPLSAYGLWLGIGAVASARRDRVTERSGP